MGDFPKSLSMEFISINDQKSGKEIKIAYSDYGTGDPVILIHGWPLSREMWEHQLEPLVNAGCRVIKYDRRGFGKSSKPWDGYDYDTLAADLHALIEQLHLRNITLVGFSMGGGEVVRYLSNYGSEKVSRIVLISSVLPFLAKTADNPDGIPADVFEEIQQQIKDDRLEFLEEFGKKFFGVNMVSHPVSKPALEYYRMLASKATARSTSECAISWASTDFRNEVSAVKVPALIIHGDADKTVPIEVSSDRTAEMIPGAQYLIYEGAPHGLFDTHREQLSRDIINFIHGSREAYSTPLAESNVH